MTLSKNKSITLWQIHECLLIYIKKKKLRGATIGMLVQVTFYVKIREKKNQTIMMKKHTMQTFCSLACPRIDKRSIIVGMEVRIIVTEVIER